MKILRALVLGVLLTMATPAMAQQPEPKPAAEYNIASCGGRDFTVAHAVVNSDKTKLTFTDFLKTPTESKKDPDPLVFDYKEEAKDKDGNISFVATTVFEKSQLKVAGLIRGNRLIGVLTVDGSLGHVYYGYIGPLGDITVAAEDKFAFCVALRSMSPETLPGILVKWLTDGDVDIDIDLSKS